MTNNERQIKNLEAQLVPILKNIELAYAKAKEILPQDVYDETVRITGLIMPPPQAIDGSYEEYTSSEEYKIYISTEYQNDVKNLTKKLEAISGTTAIMGEVAGNIASKKSILWQIKYLQEKYLEKEYRRIKKLYEAKKQEIIDDLGEFIEEGKRLNKEIADLAIAIKTDYDTRKEAAKVSYEIGSREYDVTDRVETDKRSRLLAEQNATYQFMFDAVADNIARSYGYPNYKQVPNGWINGNSPHELCHQEVLNWSLTNVV